ncbi:acetyltransferase [Syntrophus gentianae]|uniref:Acetyltransferase n=1 Tax=Syntrophus gentianae TaxID=43775 RepID=A0A1H7XNB2_9BACT|nr:acetate--CoA ligase family protein [Syntrophus gentianae]SEM35114.1 acetyltransferase [Syntrophus gentianae]
MDTKAKNDTKRITPPHFMLPVEDYRKLTAPESIALLGVTRRTGKGSNNPLEVLLEWGYRGRILPVNVAGGEILGYPVYTSLLDAPEVPDLAVICSPRNTVPEFFRQCAEKGVRIVIIVAQGFTDGDDDGVAMQEDFLKLAKEKGIRILGPNTLGVVNNFNSFCTSFIGFINPLAPVGVLCQSGIYVVGNAGLMGGTGLCIDPGNSADVEYAELIGHMARDPRLSVINIYMEGVTNGEKFMEAARDAVAHKPVITFKIGSSPAGAIAAGSHTGSMTGEDRVYDVAFRQCGIIRAETTDDVMDFNKTFQTFPGIGGNRIGVVSISGGAGIIAVDAFARYGLQVAELSEATRKAIADLSPDWFQVHNTIDVWPAAMKYGYPEVYRQTLSALLRDPGVDAVICVTGSFLESEKDFIDVSGIIHEAASEHPEKPIVGWTYGGRWQEYIAKLEKEKNVVAFSSLDRAVKSLAALYHYHHILQPRAEESLSAFYGKNPCLSLPAAGKDALELISHSPSGFMTQEDAFTLLESYGISGVRREKSENVDAAVAAAERLGYPVVLKISSPDITHKSDVGGIRLNIPDAEALRQACAEMLASVRENCPAARLTGFLVSEQISGGMEILLGCKRDSQFGPVIVFGTGGVFTEIYQDIALRIPPLDSDEILAMMDETKISRILKGYRNVPAVDIPGIVKVIMSFSDLVMNHPSIQEVDINPLLAQPDRLVVLDARILLG